MRTLNALHGTITALITPFKNSGALDEEALTRLIERQLEAEVEGIVLLGTTGEAASLKHEEKRRVLMLARQRIPDGVFFGAGTGTASTEETKENIKMAEDLGVDFALVQPPSYLKPSQEGIVAHFQELLQASTLPFLLYNNPGRAAVNMPASTLSTLFQISPRFQHLKESHSSCFAQTVEIATCLVPKFPGLKLLAGDDEMIIPTIALGGHGVVSVLSNLLPREVKSLVDASRTGDFPQAREIQRQLFPYLRAAFVDTNPVPIKTMLSFKGWAEPTCRLPLFPLSSDHRSALENLFLIPSFQ